MQIEDGDNRHGADDIADRLKEIALCIFMSFRDHGAVEIEEDGIDGHGVSESLEESLFERVVS